MTSFAGPALLILLSLLVSEGSAFVISWGPASTSLRSRSFSCGVQTNRGLRKGSLLGLRAQVSLGGNDDDDEDETNDSLDPERAEIKKLREERVLPFDKGASEFVPIDMQPAQEWMNLKETFLFDWPLMPTKDFALRMGAIWSFFTFVIGYPIASATYDAPNELGIRLLAASNGGLVVTLVLMLRLYLGVSFVSDRLDKDVVYFESDERQPITAVDLQRLGYRSQGGNWIKPESVAARDKLIRQMEVTSVESKLKMGSIGLAALVVLGIGTYKAVAPDPGFDPRFAESELRLMDLNNPANEGVAEREAERLRSRGNKPAYCYSRYYKAMAGADNDMCK